MRKSFYLKIGLLIVVFALTAAAHPLGNFSVNQYSRLEVEKSKLKIRQVLDLAEIPTVQAQAEIDENKNGALEQNELDAYAERITPEFARNLFLSVNNNPIAVTVESKEITVESGAAELPTLKIKWNLSAQLPDNNSVNQVEFENKNYAERLGWNEIIVNRINDINVFDSTAFGSAITDELKAYPQEDLNAALAERRAQFSYTSGAIPENAKVLQNRDGHVNVAVQKDRLAELIAIREVTPSIIFFGLLVAFGLGAMHAMSPGHGKAVVGAYLVGSKGTPKHAVFLGLTVTITHTLGVFALGFITLFASSYILPEKLMPFLSFVSGLLVLYIGLTMFKTRLFSALGWQNDGHHHHGDAGSHSHSADENDNGQNHSHAENAHDAFTHTHDGNTHSHLPPETVSWRSLLGLGISGGLLPCPSALVLMLSAINLGRIGYGLVLTFAFSLGLAATLTAVGLIFLYGGKIFSNSQLGESRVMKTLPVFSAFVIACLGAVICYTSL